MWVNFTQEEMAAIQSLVGSGHAPGLASLASKMKTSVECQEKAGSVIGLAQAMYADDSENNIEIDADAAVSPNDDGTWVQAWVWVEN